MLNKYTANALENFEAYSNVIHITHFSENSSTTVKIQNSPTKVNEDAEEKTTSK